MLIIKCVGCGSILYMADTLVAAEDVCIMYKWKCPKCGRTLSQKPLRIEIECKTKKGLFTKS